MELILFLLTADQSLELLALTGLHAKSLIEKYCFDLLKAICINHQVLLNFNQMEVIGLKCLFYSSLFFYRQNALLEQYEFARL